MKRILQSTILSAIFIAKIYAAPNIQTYVDSKDYNVMGIAFNDLNGNCQKDFNEELLSNRKIKIQPGNIIIITNPVGIFNTKLPIGDYTIEGVSDNYWQSNFCSVNISITAEMTSASLTSKMIGFTSIGKTADNYITVSSNSFYKGLINIIILKYGNSGNINSYNDTLHVVIPKEVVLIGASIPWSAQKGNEYIWYVSNIDKSALKNIYLIDSVSSKTSKGTQIKMYSYMNNALEESELSNNADSLYAKVNEAAKSSKPKGKYVTTPIVDNQEYLLELDNSEMDVNEIESEESEQEMSNLRSNIHYHFH